MKNGNDGVCHCKRGLEKEKRKGGVGDVCCYSFGLGQCSNAKYTKSLYNFLSDILFILNQSNVFCVLYSVFCILVVREIAC